MGIMWWCTVVLKALVLPITGLPITTTTTNPVGTDKSSVGCPSVNTVVPDDIFKEFWEWRLLNAPEFATSVGDHRYDDRLDEMSLSSYARRLDESKMFLKRVQRIRQKRQQTSMDLELLESQLQQFISGSKFKTYVWPMNRLEGPQSNFPRLFGKMKKKTKRDFQNILQRMRGFSQQIDETIALMREGIRIGWTMHNVSVQSIPKILQGKAATPVEKTALFSSFAAKPSTLNDDEWSELVNEAKTIIADVIRPSYKRLANFLNDEYLKNTRANISVSSLPNGGKQYYAALLKYHTTTNLTPDEIHGIGLSEVARIRARMLKVIGEIKYNGSLKSFQEFLRTDPSFNYSSSEQIVNLYVKIGKEVRKHLPNFFSVLPKANYTVVPIPAAGAPPAFYTPPPLDGSRPGKVYVNVHKPETKKRYEATSTMLHEGEPGHHLHGTLAIENGSSHNFRRAMEVRKYYQAPASFPQYTAYTEGWGLYAEYLGEEMGMYTESYTIFGRLSDEMLRACRLVVDTGIHGKGWNRQKAIDFMRYHTPMTTESISAEIDRYISIPGQACGYKIGELKIREARRRAEMKMKDKFDVGEFNSMVASLGGVPMEMLDMIVDRFVQQQQKQSSS